MIFRSPMVKVLCWRLISISVTYFTSLLLMDSHKEATSFTVVLHCILITFHYGFEKLWNRLGERDATG